MDIKDINKLFEEVSKGNIQYLKDYVKHNGDINSKDKWGLTIGHYAAVWGHLNCLKYYIEHDGDINAIDNDGWTIRDIAAKDDNLNIINYFNELINKDKQ